MSGASRMVGALDFAAVCEQMDHASRAGDWDAVDACIPAFECECKRLDDYFKSL
jgi:hypothetical protein